jgi:hypothetical protein
MSEWIEMNAAIPLVPQGDNSFVEKAWRDAEHITAPRLACDPCRRLPLPVGEVDIGIDALEHRSQAPDSILFHQLSRAATPHTMTKPALPNGPPFRPVMYPSRANVKMRNSSFTSAR